MIPGSIQTQYTYDAKGNYVTKTTDPLGRVTEKIYDAAGNETSEKVGSDTTFFAYDALDRLAQITDANNGVTIYLRCQREQNQHGPKALKRYLRALR